MPSPRASCSVVGERRVWFAGCDEGSRVERDRRLHTNTSGGEWKEEEEEEGGVREQEE